MFRLDQIWPLFSGLTALTGANTASGDELGIVDVSTKTTKKITRDELAVAIAAGFAADGVAGAKVADATDTTVGVSERATDAEAVTGTDTARHITPANLTARLAAPGTIGGTTPAAGIFTDITGGGNYTNPLHPAFLVYNSSNNDNVIGTVVTGAVTVEFDTEVYDQAAEFNNTTDTLTATITGRYNLNITVTLSGLTTAATAIIVLFITSNATLQLRWNLASFGINRMPVVFAEMVDLDANDTVSVTAEVRGEATDVVDILGGANRDTIFSGHLVA